jgi:branched-chain amino acid transport system ATP-binding protein
MLKVEGIQAFYGSIQGIEDVSLMGNRSEVTSLIGANGAGKSTTMKVIFGLLRPVRGSVIYEGQDILSFSPQERKKLGISYIIEERGVFPYMTVRENLMIGSYILKKNRSEAKRRLRMVFEFFPKLLEREKQMGGTLSGGEQQMLVIARGLMSEPKMLLLDEPSLGLAPIMVKNLRDTIRMLNGQGITILMAEQNAMLAFSVSHKIYVLETGKLRLSGTPDEIRGNEAVQKAYLC